MPFFCSFVFNTSITLSTTCLNLLSTPINYTLTHFADHSQRFSHDQINRYLANDRLTPRSVWEHVKPHLEQTPDGYVIFDDTVLDKRYAKTIAVARKQYSGNAGGIINGIGIAGIISRELAYKADKTRL